MRVLFDTATLLFAANSPQLLSKRAHSILADDSAESQISSLTLSEIATKNLAGKLNFSRDDLLQAIAQLRLRVLPFDEPHALRMFDLPFHHRDPFDRHIIAQALVEDIPVVTIDEKFKLYMGLTVVW